MSVNTMGRSRTGGSRAAAIAVVATFAIGIATLAPASAQIWQTFQQVQLNLLPLEYQIS